MGGRQVCTGWCVFATVVGMIIRKRQTGSFTSRNQSWRGAAARYAQKPRGAEGGLGMKAMRID